MSKEELFEYLVYKLRAEYDGHFRAPFETTPNSKQLSHICRAFKYSTDNSMYRKIQSLANDGHLTILSVTKNEHTVDMMLSINRTSVEALMTVESL